MRTPSLPKRGRWTDEDAAHLEKVLATFPLWNSEQIAVARRTFGAAQARLEAEKAPRASVAQRPCSGDHKVQKHD
ncbi:hypothetical protein [Rhodococcus erythropolis]|uniref:hypothetical protein n=1 Tax=Rhodococcus erythropolis TaxID=1833 RepID=UPI0024B75BD2|nr:hypothetical protein [Rhodococcus erythropolis]MDJ0014960.1 hypothetical protein [Rhodococcus erythropolis]